LILKSNYLNVNNNSETAVRKSLTIVKEIPSTNICLKL